MATHSIILARKISWTEEPGGLQSRGSYRVGHNRSASACVNVLAWKIPWTKEPGGLQSVGCRVWHNWVAKQQQQAYSYDPAIVSLYLPKRTKNLCPPKNLHTDIYSTFIHHCQNLEETKMSFSSRIDSPIAIRSDNGILIRTKKKWAVKSWRQWRDLNVYY